MTDLVDSTRYAREVGEVAMARVWSTHDSIARDLLLAWNGLELEKTDGIVAIFESGREGVAYALAYQRALNEASFPLRARAAIHWAASEIRETRIEHIAVGARRYEVDGLLKAISARLMSLAGGGQTLVTTQVRESVEAIEGWKWHSHGHWRLKGLEEPVEVLEVRDDQSVCAPLHDAEKAFRVVNLRDLWVPAREISQNLPAERDAFVGRRAVLDDLSGRFAGGSRLVSLVGVGGAGKTRLAIRHAWEHSGEYGGGAWFCDLAQARTFDGLCHAAAQGLGISLTDKDPLAQLGRAIAGRGHCLVILDNFEQVVAHAEATVGTWLECAPSASFLVTTREMLGIRGEEALTLAPMLLHEGVDLFLRRARAAKQSYSPTADELDAVSHLVRGLDGLPLALELAAARVTVSSAASMLAKLNKRFDWLWTRSGRRDRQATLRAAFDWSWDLLGEREKATLGYLSVFEGGFTPEAAEAVVGEHALDEAGGISAVESLVAKSLLNYGDEGRFQILESVREYAHQQLSTEGRFEGSGPVGALGACERHWLYYGGLDEAQAAASKADASNLVVAVRRAIASGSGEAAAACALRAWALLLLAGPYRIGADLADALLAMPDLPPRGRGLGHWIAASAKALLGEVKQARAHLLAGLEGLTSAPDAGLEARLLTALGYRQSLDAEIDAADKTLAAAEMCAVAAGDVRLRVLVAINQGKHLSHLGRMSDARVRYEEALSLCRQPQDHRLRGGILGNLGAVHHSLGRLSEARVLYQQSVEIAHEVGDLSWEGNSLCNLGLLCQEDGDMVEARACLLRSGAVARAIGHLALEHTVQCNLGILAESEGRLAEAVTAFKESVGAARRAGDGRAEGQYLGYLANALAHQGEYDQAIRCLDVARERLGAMSDQLSLTVLACQRAEVCAIAGKSDLAKQALIEARAMVRRFEAGPESELARQFARAEVALANMVRQGLSKARHRDSIRKRSE